MYFTKFVFNLKIIRRKKFFIRFIIVIFKKICKLKSIKQGTAGLRKYWKDLTTVIIK